METVRNGELLKNMYHQGWTLRCQCPVWFPIHSLPLICWHNVPGFMLALSPWESVTSNRNLGGSVSSSSWSINWWGGTSIVWGVPFGGGLEIGRSQRRSMHAACLPACLHLLLPGGWFYSLMTSDPSFFRFKHEPWRLVTLQDSSRCLALDLGDFMDWPVMGLLVSAMFIKHFLCYSDA